MAPLKKSSGSSCTASKRGQGGASQPARYGIQHFFARHSSQSTTPQTAAPAATMLNPSLSGQATHAPHPSSTSGRTSAPATEVQATRTANLLSMRVPSTGGQMDVSDSTLKDGIKSVNLKNFDIVDPGARKENVNILSNKCHDSLKRRRPSLGMVVQQSQDDGGEEVVWKVSPTAERLLSTCAADTAVHKKERFALRPCQTTENQINGVSVQDASNEFTNALGGCRGVSPHLMASPGMAGKLEQWLSFGDLLSDGLKSSHVSVILADAANKENNDLLNLSPVVSEKNLPPIKPSKSARTPLTKLRRRSIVGGYLSKKSIPKQAKLGERRKALLQLLDQVQDAVSSEKSTSELPTEESLVSRLAQENASDLAESTDAQQLVTEKCKSSEHAADFLEGLTPHDNFQLNKGDKHGHKVVLEPAEKVLTFNKSSTSSTCSPSYLRLPGNNFPCQCVSVEQHSASTAKGDCCTVRERPQNHHTELLALKPMLYPKANRSQLSGKMQDTEDSYRAVGASPRSHVHMQKDLHDWSVIHFLVLEVSEGTYATKANSTCFLQKILLLLNEENGTERVVNLRDEWMYTVVRPGDNVNVIGEFDMDGIAIVDHDNNFLIVNPDTLISGSRIGASFTCPRRAVLDERIKFSDLSSHALLGTLLHQLFQVGLRMEEPNKELLEHEAVVIVQRHIDSLYAIAGDERDAYKKLVEAIPTILDWLHRFHNPLQPSIQSQVDFGRADGQQQLSVTQVLDIEEMIWSPKFGMKGMIDASLKIKAKDHTLLEKDLVMPFELKTGKATSGKAAMEHRAQVMLYTLLMSDRYAEEVKAGLLFYLHTNQTQGIGAQHGDLTGLLIRRNEHASSILAASSSQILPSMLQNLHTCQGCRLLDICSVYHKGQGGTSESSGLGELFDAQISHLNKNHYEFLQHWDHLIDLEARGIYASQSEIWRTPSSSREEQGRCLSSMMLDFSTGYSGDEESSNDRFVYCFRRVLPEPQLNAAAPKVGDGASAIRLSGSLQDRSFSCGDFVLSTESGHVAVAGGYIVSINLSSVLISLSRRLRLPESNANLERGRLLQEIWRIDKDEITSSWSTMRYNLLQLFVKSGDEQRRRLIVDLEEPKFDIGGLISQDPAIMYARSLPGVNDDQRRAILKILAARDYALILGMPGTGKTSTIVHAVQALCARGASVLLASYTNSAVDNILLKLKLQKIDFIRVGRLEAVHPELQEHVIGGSGNNMMSVRELRTKVDQAQVVGCTCLGITHAIFRNRKFDVCIIDEAGQITLPVTLGPLRCAKTFVLVGDHYQLPPLVRNPEAREKGMSISLFRRLSEAHPQAVSALHCQYRMCSDIMALCNTLIYGHRLRCGSAEVANARLELANAFSHTPQWLQQVLDANNCVIFLNTDCIPAHEQHVKNAVKNVIEASILLEIVKCLVTGGVPVQSIGVISPYNAQVDGIQKLSMEHGLSGLEIHTVDKYQVNKASSQLHLGSYLGKFMLP
ncbi:hypothetical protein O6H91_12G043000 [Diphasiastrum complanatum]|uniref:Uncharacterized protein n=1 Tax=Diphasiastrum complanatum TaxID=34168 RepID=A0ACC2C106_DIPCM|nr:hypothetical protein O6H91_12G043000 [Diphasiastrum complanatum]